MYKTSMPKESTTCVNYEEEIQMTEERRKNKIIYQLQELGYRPRENKDLDNYIRYLRYKLRRNNKDISIVETDDDIKVTIIPKPEKKKKDRKVFFRVSEEDYLKYKIITNKKKVSFAKLVRDLLDAEYERNKN